MLFIVRFTDKPGSLPLREQLLEAHLEWLKQHHESVRVAGSLRTEPGAPPIGALWIVKAESTAAVESLFLTDPFWQHGIRQNVEVLHWSKAFPDRTVAV